MNKFLMGVVLFFTALYPRFCSGEPSYRLSIHFDSPSFSGNITRGQVREVFGRILKGRTFTFKRARVTLKGSPQTCNVFFEFLNGTISNDVSFSSIKGRVPVGNLLLLINDRLKWPVSVVMKDLSIKLSGDSLEKIVVNSNSIQNVEIIGSQCVCKGNLGILWKKENRNEVLVKEFYKRGISLTLRKQLVYIKNLNPKPVMILSGLVPEYLGQIKLLQLMMLQLLFKVMVEHYKLPQVLLQLTSQEMKLLLLLT